MPQQKGVALIVFLIVIVLVGVSVFMTTMSPVQLQMQQDRDEDMVLREAKQALIDISLNYDNYSGSTRGPGYLICPDTDNDGDSDAINPASNCVDRVGRLPYIDLGRGEFRDKSNEILWYAVSNNFDYTNVPAQHKLNTDNSGQITVRDSNGAILSNGTNYDAVVAVIIAPGAMLVRADGYVQQRTAGVSDLTDPGNYLDIVFGEDNATYTNSSLDGFIAGEAILDGAVVVNDKIITITYEDIMDRVHDRVFDHLQPILTGYEVACGILPDAANFDPAQAAFNSVAAQKTGMLPIDTASPTPANWGVGCVPAWPAEYDWFWRERWHSLALYEKCDPGVQCITVDGTPAEAVLVFAGRELPGQNRNFNNSTDITDYFEGDNNDADSSYTMNEPEDYVYIIR